MAAVVDVFVITDVVLDHHRRVVLVLRRVVLVLRRVVLVLRNDRA